MAARSSGWIADVVWSYRRTRLNALADIIARRRAAAGERTLIVGITGGVAAGKSTLARELAAHIVEASPRTRVEVVGTDAFLRGNADLEAAGLTLRKGYPETYDAQGLKAALDGVRRGPTAFPGYSHGLYDIDRALTRTLDRPDILFVEGLGLGGAPVDLLIYLDADEDDLERWYVERFVGLWEAGKSDPSSFYARFAAMSAGELDAFARQVWRGINLPNIREHVRPLKKTAEVVVYKGRDHAITSVTERD